MRTVIEPEVLTNQASAQYKRQKARKKNNYGRREAANLLKISPTTLYQWDIELACLLPEYGAIWKPEAPLHPYQYGCLKKLKRLRKSSGSTRISVSSTIKHNINKFTVEVIANELSRLC